VADVPFYLPEICGQSDQPLLKTADFDQYLLITSQPYKLAKTVQLSRIGSRPRAFQRAIDEVRTLPLTPPRGGSKSEFVVFMNKININRINFAIQSFFA